MKALKKTVDSAFVCQTKSRVIEAAFAYFAGSSKTVTKFDLKILTLFVSLGRFSHYTVCDTQCVIHTHEGKRMLVVSDY